MREPHSLLYDALPGAWAGWFVLITSLLVVVSAVAGNDDAKEVLKDSGDILVVLYGAAAGITVANRRIKTTLDAKADIDTAKAGNVRMQTAAGAAEGEG